MKKIQLIFCKVRLFFLKISHRKSYVNFKGFSNISRKTLIEVGKNSVLTAGYGLHTRSGVVLAVRGKAYLSIGNNVFINRNTIITARKSIIIEDEVTIGPNVCIYDHDHDMHRGYLVNNVIIKKKSWIGAGVIILKGVTIGENCVVASGSVVTKDVPDNSILIQKRQSIYK